MSKCSLKGTLHLPKKVLKKTDKKVQTTACLPARFAGASARRVGTAAVAAKPERLGAILVDWDNLVIPAKRDRNFDSSEINIQLMRALLEASLKFVDKAHLFVFTSEGHLKRNSFYLEVAAEDFEIELIKVPTVKDAADEEIRKKAEELANSNPEISTFIFASGDGYFARTIAKLITNFGKKAVLMPYSKESMHRIYREINVLSNKFSIIFLKPHFCKNG